MKYVAIVNGTYKSLNGVCAKQMNTKHPNNTTQHPIKCKAKMRAYTHSQTRDVEIFFFLLNILFEIEMYSLNFLFYFFQATKIEIRSTFNHSMCYAWELEIEAEKTLWKNKTKWYCAYISALTHLLTQQSIDLSKAN